MCCRTIAIVVLMGGIQTRQYRHILIKLVFSVSDESKATSPATVLMNKAAVVGQEIV
jgi:hypothetical protein